MIILESTHYAGTFYYVQDRVDLGVVKIEYTKLAWDRAGGQTAWDEDFFNCRLSVA